MMLTLLLLLSIGAVTGNEETLLRESLLQGYDSHALPNELTNISLSFTILHVHMDEAPQILMMDAWLKMDWHDPRLTWSTEMYPNVGRLAFDESDVWIPDLTLYNNAKSHISKHINSGYHVLALPNGKIIHVPSAKLPAPCILDLTYWPRDTHTCSLKFGSWVYSGYEINLTRVEGGKADVTFEPKALESNGRSLSRGVWTIDSTSLTFDESYYPCCPEPYVSATLQVVVTRNAPAYCWTVGVPAIVLSALTGILFMLPTGSMEKIVVGTLVLILDMQFLSYTKDIVQHSPSHTPLIVQLISEQLLITLVCLLVSAVIVKLVRGPHSDSLPNYLRKIVEVLERPLCLGSYRTMVKESGQKSYEQSNVMHDHQESEDKEAMMMDPGSRGNVFQTVAASEWLMFGALLDRILLIIYVVAFFIKMIRYGAVL